MTGFVSAVSVIVRKDLLVEARTREILFTTLFFAVACVLVFAFGFVREGRAVSDAAAAEKYTLARQVACRARSGRC